MRESTKDRGWWRKAIWESPGKQQYDVVITARDEISSYCANFSGREVVRNLPANAGDTGSIPDPGRSHIRRATKPVSHNY